ncbi:MAG: nitroreductase family deazaflavin-dependent oxidoreductase [Candidatus Dadabacteria bacterium]|nr:nitroreductase family deazaflavin-dependent oxidoreductase [Candidatus Dadabacteria bacterium]
MHTKNDGAIKRMLAWFGSTRAGAWTIINIGSAVDRWLITASGGKLNTTFAWPCLLLKTTGAKTGKERTTPLLYLKDGGSFVLIASKGGNARHPSWYLNLRANPEAEVFVDGESIKCTASDAQGEERDRLWEKAVGVYDAYEKYRRRAGEREIPVVVLRPQ